MFAIRDRHELFHVTLFMCIFVMKIFKKTPLSCRYAGLANFLSSFKENRCVCPRVVVFKSMFQSWMINFVAREVGAKIRIDFPKVPWMPICFIRFCGLVVELHMHTNVYAVYACDC